MNGDTKRIDWTHPSWRDVVIEHLAEHPQARLQFLERCGSDGMELAVSTSGGADGDRRHPLLCSHDDWAALTERARLLVRSCHPDEHRRLLSALRVLVEEVAPEAPSEQAALASAVLDATVERWDDEGEVVDARTLEVFYATTELVAPLCRGPQLARMLASHAALLRSLSTVDPEEVEQQEALHTLLVAERNEPRALRQLRYPQCLGGFPEVLATAIERLRTRVGKLADDDCLLVQGISSRALTQLRWELDAWESLLDGLPGELGIDFDEVAAIAEAIREVLGEVHVVLDERMHLAQDGGPVEIREADAEGDSGSTLSLRKLFADL